MSDPAHCCCHCCDSGVNVCYAALTSQEGDFQVHLLQLYSVDIDCFAVAISGNSVLVGPCFHSKHLLLMLPTAVSIVV